MFEDFDRIIDSLYDAADDPAGFAPALVEIGNALAATACHTLVIPTTTTVIESHHYGADPSSFHEYERHWRDQDPRFAFAIEKPGAVLSDVMVIDSDEFERSALYNEHLLVGGARYTLFGAFRAGSELTVASAFMRPKHLGAFQSADIERMRVVVPHLTRAVRLRHTVSLLRDELADLRRALDAAVMPTMVLDETAAIVCANRSAEDLLRAADGLASDRGKLRAIDITERAALGKAIARAVLGAEARGGRNGERPRLEPSVKISRRDGTKISLALLPLRAQNVIRTRATGKARVLVLIHDPSRIVRVDRALIAELHGLTATEAELAASLAEGKTLAEFAEARGSSEQTARTHLKRILDKTETRRQADLVRLLLTGVAVHGIR